jgi:hypothetical protein
VNETTAETTAATGTASAAEALAERQLQHVGWAYSLIFVLLFAFAWRATTATRRLSERVDELERDTHS